MSSKNEKKPIVIETLIQHSRSDLLKNANNIESEYYKFKLYKNVKSRPLSEEEHRDAFKGYIDYLLYCFSLTGSLANLTRFPYLAYTYNGCSFVVQFLILIVLIGIPWCFMETALGQYSGRGPTVLGDMVPIGKGVAVAMGYICLLNVICYSPIQSRCLLYMYWSLAETQLPWKSCSFVNSSECIDNVRYLSNTSIKSVGIELRVPAENFYLNEIVAMDKNVLYDGLGELNEPLLYCLIISWIINLTFLIKSNNFMKYVQIFGSIAPYTFLFVMLFIIMMDKDAWGGFYTLLDPDTIDFLDLQSWRRAAEQVLYSLDVGTGHLIIYGQNCYFRNNILKDIMLVTLLNTVCALAAALVIFGTANIIACKFHIAFYSVFISGPGMFFIAIARAVVELPYPRLFGFLSFFIVFIICILTQYSYLKPVIFLLNTYFNQHNANLTRYSSSTLCVTMFAVSIVTVTKGGEMFISLLDDIGSAMGILMITTFEAILIFGIYGINEFCADLAFMTDRSPSIILKLLFIGAPVFSINVIYPPLMYSVAWSVAVITLLILLISAIHTIIKFVKIKNFFGSFEPTDQWVPDLVYAMKNNQLEPMAAMREEQVVQQDCKNHLIFGIGKPRVYIKVDNATQTDTPDNTHLEDSISNQLIQHFYLEVFNNSCEEFQLERKHNENKVIAWNNYLSMETSLDNGILEKYVQTD